LPASPQAHSDLADNRLFSHRNLCDDYESVGREKPPALPPKVLKRFGDYKKASGLSNYRIARKAGLTRQFVGNFFAGRRGASASTLARLAFAIGMTPDSIFAGLEGVPSEVFNDELAELAAWLKQATIQELLIPKNRALVEAFAAKFNLPENQKPLAAFLEGLPGPGEPPRPPRKPKKGKPVT